MKFFKIAGDFLPHLLLSFSLMLLTFCVINFFNTSMQFLDSRLSQRFEVIYAACTVILAIVSLIRKRLRLISVMLICAGAAFAVPVCRAIFSDSSQLLTAPYFRYFALAMCLITLVYSVITIITQRREA